MDYFVAVRAPGYITDSSHWSRRTFWLDVLRSLRFIFNSLLCVYMYIHKQLPFSPRISTRINRYDLMAHTYAREVNAQDRYMVARARLFSLFILREPLKSSLSFERIILPYYIVTKQVLIILNSLSKSVNSGTWTKFIYPPHIRV